jgi:predicted Zn-dependent protease
MDYIVVSALKQGLSLKQENTSMSYFRVFFLSLILIVASSCVTTPVTGKRAFIVVPFSQEVELGNSAYRDFLNKEKANISSDPKMNEVVRRVALRIARASDMPNLNWEFKVINSKEVNAFCLPGGKIVIYTGIMPICKTEAGLAAVIAHEVAHAVARHGAQRISQQVALSSGLSLASLSFDNSKYKDLIIASLGAGMTIGVVLPYSRDNEYEADEIGTIYMARAGYDPKEAVALWERFSRQYGTGQTPEFLSTHPYSDNRSKRLKQEVLPRAMVEYERSPKYGAGVNL